MKKTLLFLIVAVTALFLGGNLYIDAAPYQDYVDNGTQYTAVSGDTWVSSGSYDYMVPKGYKPYDVLTNSTGTEIGTYFISSGTFSGSTYIFYLNGMNSVSYWSGSDWVSFSGSDLSLRKSGENWGWYQYGGAVLVANISGSSPSIGLRRTVTDLQPAISGQSTYVSNVDNPLSETAIRATITVIDDVDGDISHLIELVQDNYTANKNVLGLYTIDYRVADSAGNEATFTAQIKVVDGSKPVLSGPSTVNVSYTKLQDLNTFIAQQLSVSDNYDEDLVIGIESNSYTANYNRIGSYQVVFNSIDNSNNKGLHTTTFNVIDDVAPVWSGATTIVKNATEILTVNEIKSRVTATDYIDGVLPHIIKTDGYTDNAFKVGSYQVVFEATDASGNKSTKTVTISVVDNIPPVFFVDNYWINVGTDTILTQQQIIDLLIATNQIEVGQQTEVQFLVNEYESNEEVPGVYAMSLMTRTSTGVETQKSFAITVLETSTFTVSFETNGGNDINPIQVEQNGNVLVQTPIKEGYIFIGWFKNQALTDQFSIVNDIVSEDITLYAKWTPINSGGGSLIIDNVTNFTPTDYVIITFSMVGIIAVVVYFVKKKK